jgi:hypothetical protein
MDDGEKLKIAVQALKDVYDPVGRLRREAEAGGCTLNGFMTMQICLDPQIYRDTAREALKEIGEVVAQ